MARTRLAKHPRVDQIEPPPIEEESEKEPKFQLGENGQPSSKADMVRQVLAEGITTPTEGVTRIKQLFGIDLPKPMWSSYVAGFKRRDGGAPSRIRTHVSSQPQGIPVNFGADVKEIRALIEKTGGSEELRELIGQLNGLLGKYGAGGLGELIEAIS